MSRRLELLGQLIEQGVLHCPLVSEMVVDGPDRVAGPFGNIGERGGVDAPLVEEGRSGVEQSRMSSATSILQAGPHPLQICCPASLRHSPTLLAAVVKNQNPNYDYVFDDERTETMTSQTSSTASSGSIERIARGDYQVHTQIDINAPASVVWDTLTDFDNYSWSTSFKGLDGPVEPGANITATFRMMGRDQTIEHELIEVEPGVQWAWSDVFMLGIADYHVYRVEPLTEVTSRFIQRDRPHGGAAVVLGRYFAGNFRKMYLQFNSELKAEAERRYRRSQ